MRFSDPVTGKAFIGREEILQLLKKRASGLPHGYRHNIALLGPTLIGKSSLLLRFLETFHEQKTLSLYFECRSGEAFEPFINRFLNTFLYQFLKQIQGAAPKESPLLEERAKALTPKTVQEIGALRQANHLTHTERFNRLLELLRLFHQEFRTSLVLVLDEFDKLLELDVAEPFTHLGKQIMVQRQTMVVVASSHVGLAEKILKQKLNLLFGHFETVSLGPFDAESARLLLRSRWDLRELTPEFQEYLLLLTGGHPFYLNVLGEELQKAKGLASQEEFFHCFERQLLNAHGILAQYFNSLTERLSHQDRSGSLLTLLKIIAEGRYTAGALRGVLRDKGLVRGLKPKLERLVALEFLGENGSFFFLKDSLFAFWLSSCFTKQSESFSRSTEELLRSFRQEMKERFRRFLVSRGQEPTEKIQQLFEAFRGEMVEMDRKKHRLPPFQKVLRVVGGGEGVTLEARSEGGLWVLAIHAKPLHEEEVRVFLDRCKRSGTKIQKKILIPLKGMDQNARLLAKEARLWTWELPQLNFLFWVHGQESILEEVVKDG